MSEELKKCKACDDVFCWNDKVVEVNDEFYHNQCVKLFPTGYFAFLDGEPLGETENEDGDSAFAIFDEGEYEDDV